MDGSAIYVGTNKKKFLIFALWNGEYQYKMEKQ